MIQTCMTKDTSLGGHWIEDLVLREAAVMDDWIFILLWVEIQIYVDLNTNTIWV